MNRKSSTLLLITVGLVLVVGATIFFFLRPQDSTPLTNNIPVSPPDESITDTNGLKLYRNEKWGFEFEYLGDWATREPAFYSTVSLFNMDVGPNESGITINITPKEWIENALVKMRARGVVTKDIILASRPALQIEDRDEFSRPATITLVLVNDKFWIDITGVHTYQTEYNQLIKSFKFLK